MPISNNLFLPSADHVNRTKAAGFAVFHGVHGAGTWALLNGALP